MSVRTYPDVPRVYLDVDGPLADFEGYCAERGISPDVAKVQEYTYFNLGVTPGAQAGVEALTSRDDLLVFALTKISSRNPYAATEKLLWLRHHFPTLGDRVIISPDKGCVGTSRDLLVDDHPEWANADHFPGRVVCFGAEARDWAALLTIIGDNYA